MRENDARKLTMLELNERRRQAVQCRITGMGLKETAELCGMSRNTVNQA